MLIIHLHKQKDKRGTADTEFTDQGPVIQSSGSFTVVN